MKANSRLLLAFVIALALDVSTKAWAGQTLTLYRPVPVIGGLFRLTLGYNTGVAFGLFATGGNGPLIVTGVVITVLAIWSTWSLWSGEFTATAAWPLGMILGGAIANFIDRLPDMRVTDFLDIGLGAARWPTFNLADTFVVVGAIILVLTTLLAKPSPEEER